MWSFQCSLQPLPPRMPGTKDAQAKTLLSSCIIATVRMMTNTTDLTFDHQTISDTLQKEDGPSPQCTAGIYHQTCVKFG
ncbi:hypothetical protein GOODEAATRI_006912, partial [Goodea atripinnis]